MEVIGDDNTQFYVRDVRVSEESDAKLVNVSAIFKNVEAGQQTIYPSTVRLVDSQSREYEPEYSSKYPSAKLPSNDILAWNGEFNLPIMLVRFTLLLMVLNPDSLLI